MLNRESTGRVSAAAILIATLVTLSLLRARGQSTLDALPLIADWAWNQGKPGSVGSIAVSPDGRFVLSGHYETSILWDVQSNRGLTGLPGHQGGVYVAFLGDGQRAVTASTKREVFIWEIPSGRKLASWGTGGDDIRSLAASPDGRHIALGHDDNTLRVWDVATGKLVWSQGKVRGWITGLSYTPDGKLLITGQQSMVSIWDAGTGAAIAHIETASGQVWSISVSPDNRMITAVDLGSVKIIDIETKKVVATIQPPSGWKAWYEEVAFLRDGRHVAVVDSGSHVLIGSLRTNEFVAKSPDPPAEPKHVAISPDGKRAYVGLRRFEGAVLVLDLSSLR